MAAANTLFPALRLSPEDFEAHKRRLPRGPSRALPSTGNGIGRNAHLVKVTGYGQEAKEAILAANDGAGDTVEVPWHRVDSVFWIMQRVEDKLRIPLEHWHLAGQGYVLLSGAPVRDHDLFCMSNTIVEVVLVPSNALGQYVKENPPPAREEEYETYEWRHLQPGTTDSTDPLEKAKAVYNLINPAASSSWEIYASQRKKAEEQLDSMTESYPFVEYAILLNQVKSCIKYVIEDLNLEEEQRLAIADGILSQSLHCEDNGDSEDPVSAKLFTRIYSPTKSAAVDVYFTYWNRTRYDSVEFSCDLLFRIHDPIADVDVPRVGSPVKENGTVARGWTRVFRMGFDPHPPAGRRWYTKRIMDWGLRAQDVARLHSALFGRAGRVPASAVDRVDAVRVLLAAVGIPFQVARDEGATDALNPEDRVGAFTWKCFHDRWIGTNIRAACGTPLLKDADWQISDDEQPSEGDRDSEDDSDREDGW